MKKIIIASMVALLGIGSASADYQSETKGYVVNNINQDFSSLPATAAGNISTGAQVLLPTEIVHSGDNRPKL